MDDERIKKGGAADVRGDRGSDDGRSGSGLLSEEDAFEKFIAEEFTETALPSPPPIPGWHLCWLTSSSAYDSIHKRMRMGYVPVRRSDMPDFDPSNGQKLAGYDENITCNEMVLFKLEDSKYQAIMRHFHHTKPLQEEEGIVARAPESKNTQRVGGEDDALSAMEREIAIAKRARPVFD
jgi:hypothetical protein